MFVDNRNIDIKELHNEERETILNSNNHSEIDRRDSDITSFKNKRMASLKRLDTIDEEGLGNFCYQFRIL